MKLYVYDHCPFCVKARMIFGIKKIGFDLITLANDDEKTPTSMVGQKMVPILEREDGSFMAESMDIIDYIDDNYGKDKHIVNYEIDCDIETWLGNISPYYYPLCMPRWVNVGFDEFKTKSAVDYFTKKKEDYIGSFKQHLTNSSESIKMANHDLKDLDKILENHKYPDEDHKITEDDVHLFAALRSLSVVKGLRYGNNVEKYRQKMSKLCEIPLHDNIAI